MHQNHLGSVTNTDSSSSRGVGDSTQGFFSFFFFSLADSDKQIGLRVTFLELSHGFSNPAIPVVQSIRKYVLGSYCTVGTRYKGYSPE